MVSFFSSRRRHTRYIGDWSSDVCSSDLKRKNSATAESSISRPCSAAIPRPFARAKPTSKHFHRCRPSGAEKKGRTKAPDRLFPRTRACFQDCAARAHGGRPHETRLPVDELVHASHLPSHDGFGISGQSLPRRTTPGPL